MTLRNDLVIILVGNIILAALVIADEMQLLPLILSILRIPLSVAYLLFIPGYLLNQAFFPGNAHFDGYERIALSFGLSLAILPALALLLTLLSLPFNPPTILLSVTLLIIVLSTATLLRRSRIPDVERAYPTFTHNPLTGGLRNPIGVKLQYIVLAIASTLIIMAAALVITTPNPTEMFTEFYLLNEDGLARDYPETVTVNQPASVIAGIMNQEGTPTQYWIEVLQGTTVIERTPPFTLEDDETRELDLIFIPTVTGTDQTLSFHLYRDAATPSGTTSNAQPYRTTRLIVDILQRAS